VTEYRERTRRRVLMDRARRLAVDVTPLRTSRDFRALWLGELVSQVGSQITVVALFVQVYAMTGSSAAVGVIGLVQLVPMVFVSIGFGPQIDVRDRRRLLLGAQLGLMVASLLLLLGAHMGNPPLALVYVAAALNAAFASVATPTRAAMIPNLVPVDTYASAAALNQVMWTSAAVVGPALGGIVVAQLGLTWAYGIDVASFGVALTAALVVHSQRPVRPDGAEHEGVIAAILTGFRFLSGKRVLQSTFTVDIVAMVFGNMGRDSATGVATTRPAGRKSPATLTASLTSPPPLSRRSRMSHLTPRDRSFVTACPTSRPAPWAKALRAT